jgi:hypothetical protein
VTRSRASAKKAGSAFETLVANYLAATVDDRIERRTRNGAQDRGDVAGVAGVCIEAKAEKKISLAEYLNETEAEKANAGAAVAACWIKRPRKSSPAEAYVVMSGAQFVELLKAAGY